MKNSKLDCLHGYDEEKWVYSRGKMRHEQDCCRCDDDDDELDCYARGDQFKWIVYALRLNCFLYERNNHR